MTNVKRGNVTIPGMDKYTIAEIMYPLSYKETLSFCSVSTQTSQICNDPSFWREKAQRKFNITSVEFNKLNYDKQSIRDRYLYLSILNGHDYDSLPSLLENLQNFNHIDTTYNKYLRINLILLNILYKNDIVIKGSELLLSMINILKLAGKNGQLDLITYFIGDTLNITGIRTLFRLYSIVYGAAIGNHINIVNEYLQKYPGLIEEEAFKGAILGGNIELYKTLLQYNIRARVKLYMTLAILSGDYDMYETVILDLGDEHGIDMYKLMLSMKIERILQSAGKGGNIDIINDIIKYIIDTGHDYNLNAPLIGAAQAGNLDLMITLINQGANGFNDAFIESVRNNNVNVIKYLIENDYINTTQQVKEGFIKSIHSNALLAFNYLADKYPDVLINNKTDFTNMLQPYINNKRANVRNISMAMLEYL